MASTIQAQGALVDLLDRVLDRGLVINADIVICLAGVPLIGINLAAALAGIETMLEHGRMAAGDQGVPISQAMGEVPRGAESAGG